MEDYIIYKYYKEHNKEDYSKYLDKEGHFTKESAEYMVKQMYHIVCGVKHCGEVYCMEKALEIHERYKNMLPENITTPDIYVALNALYHDYSELYKMWFNNDVDQHIIESAIVFWFQDDDYKDGLKIVNYFKR